METNIAIAILSAIAVCGVNLIIAIVIAGIAIKKDWQSFNKLIFGAMAVRFVLIMISLWVGISILSLHTKAYVLTILVSIFVFTIIEIVYLNHQAKSLKAKYKDNLKI